MQPSTRYHLTALLVALVLAWPLAATAQDTDPPAPSDATSTANAEAREQYSSLIDEAAALAEAGDPSSLLMAAQTYLDAHEVAHASNDTDLMERATNAKENAVKAFVDAGSAFASAENHTAAAEAFDNAATAANELENAELEAKARYNASVAYMGLENFEQALAAIDRAIVLIPEDLNYLYVRGITQRSAGDAEGAVETFAELETKATEADDDAMVTKARENIGKTHLIVANAAVKAKRYQQALASLDLAADFLPEDDRTLNLLYANAYYRLGVDRVQSEQLDTAETALKQAKTYAQKAGQDKIVEGANAQLDYIVQVRAHQQ